VDRRRRIEERLHDLLDAVLPGEPSGEAIEQVIERLLST
jgi:hypothetical protein